MLKAMVVGRACYDINLIYDKPPVEGTTLEFPQKQGCAGGTGNNMAQCLAKWGINTTFACVLGNDIYGQRIKEELSKARIDTRFIEPSYENDTTLSIVMVNKSTTNHIIHNVYDKYVSLKKCDIDFSPDLLLCDGYDIIQAKNLAERFPKAISVLDASIILPSVANAIPKFKYAILTIEMAEAITKVKTDYQNPESLVRLYQHLKKKYLNTEIVVTLGIKGALYSINNEIKITPSLKVDVKDTNGSGSVFRAAFAHTIASGGDVEKAVKIGCIAGSLSTREYCIKNSIPTYEEIKNIYEQNYQ